MDMLVKLYALGSATAAAQEASHRGVIIRRAMPYDRPTVTAWVAEQFGSQAALWPAECETAFCRVPPTCFIAHVNSHVVGFACYDATCKGFLGPIGVSEDMRGQGVGKGLLLAALQAMSHDGYAYAIVGSAGNEAFFAHTASAVAIAGSEPGIYTPPLRSER